MTYVDLFLQFMLISLLAFGGGRASLSMIERISIYERGWINPSQFSMAVALSYITPGPVLITATFIGHQYQGLLGAVAATIGVFLMPCLLAGLISSQTKRLSNSKWLKSFQDGTSPAIIGVLGVVALSQARQAAFTEQFNFIYIIIAIIAAMLSLATKIHPSLIAMGGIVIGLIISIN